MTDLGVDGSPEECRQAADQLREAHRLYERLESDLAEIARESAGAWQGVAGEGFRHALADQRSRAASLVVVTRELAAGLDLLADGLTAARADMERARAALHAGGIPLTGDSLPPSLVIEAVAADPDAALAAYDRARGFVALGRTVEAAAQQAWYVAISGALRELGSGPPPVAIDTTEPSDGSGLFGLVPDLDRLDDWLPSMPDLPFELLPGGPLPNLRDVAESVKGLAVDGNPFLAGSREFVEQLLEDSGREDLGLVERLGRAGVVGFTTYAGGLGAGAVCARFAPRVIPACTRVGVSGGSWVGNWLIDQADRR